MRVLGIDPGTGSFDFYGQSENEVILDTTVPVGEVAQNPEILLTTIRQVLPLDIIVGPSGYGIPVTPISQMTEKELNLMVPDDKSIPLYEGIRMVLRLMQSEGWPVVFTPGVIQLPTVPVYRKANKLDMGTADKLCCVALALRDHAELLGIPYSETSFIMVEVGYAFNAVIAVDRGKVVDGLGGTSGGPGFLTLGSMDSELAIRLGNFPGTVLFTGGARNASAKEGLTPEEMVDNPGQFQNSWNMLIESIQKDVAAMMVSVPQPQAIILSGRLSRISGIYRELETRLSQFGPVRLVRRKAKVAKEAAEGAFILGNGLLGGKYSGLVESLEIKAASGTMYDYILIKGAVVNRP